MWRYSTFGLHTQTHTQAHNKFHHNLPKTASKIKARLLSTLVTLARSPIKQIIRQLIINSCLLAYLFFSISFCFFIHLTELPNLSMLVSLLLGPQARWQERLVVFRKTKLYFVAQFAIECMNCLHKINN